MEKRAVYCMNLKDNRESDNLESSKEKFDFCFKNEVVGIGWVSNENHSEPESAFADAKKYLSALNSGDLIWIKKPYEDLYYIAEILDEKPFIPNDIRYAEHDLSYCRKCNFHKVGSKNNVPSEYADYLKRLVTPQTIQPRTDTELIDAVNIMWLNSEPKEAQKAEDKTDILPPAKKLAKEIFRKYKVLFIVLLCAIIGTTAFFTVHGIVYNAVSENTRNEMDKKLCGKTFVNHTDEDTMDVVIIKKENNASYVSYSRTMYDVPNKSAEIKCENYALRYDYSYWGNITAIWINGNLFPIASQEDIVGFGDYSLATDEDFESIKAIDDRLKTKCPLSDFMMTIDEYRAAYKASGMPISNKFIDLDMKDMCILYKNESEAAIMITDNGVPDTDTIRVVSDFYDGKSLEYKYLLGPIMLYLKNIPGALTDINELVDRWDNVEEDPNFAGEIVSEFTHNGITYYKNELSTGSRIYIEIAVNKKHEIYLADYPEFVAKEKDDDSVLNNEDQVNNSTPINNSIPIASDNTDSNDISETDPCASEHNWVPETKTVHHDEVGHYENIVTGYGSVEKYQCSYCNDGKWYSSLNKIIPHFRSVHDISNQDQILQCCYTSYDQTPVYEKRWIVDKEAYDETVITGYKCSVCGKQK